MSGRGFRTFNVLDDYRREILSIEVDTNLPTARVIRMPERIAGWRGYPEKLRVDSSPGFTSAQLAGWTEQYGMRLSLFNQENRHKIST